ncbi:hypothetical protein FNH08_40765 [Streptomyces spongiae]|uniref:SLATT domain-containing protein n=1 Tax=Streptomyces spongiae TaxID=565072 RepID=A0A5N8XV59_9ACTN|nr:hypothetical protein [Streptomyces spongiae]
MRARNWARFWHSTHILLGFPAAVLAAISGAAGLASADLRVPAALLALLAAGFSAGEGFLRSDSRAAVNQRRKVAWRVLEAEARLVMAREAYTDPSTLYDALHLLLEQRKIAMVGAWGVPEDAGPQPDSV